MIRNSSAACCTVLAFGFASLGCEEEALQVQSAVLRHPEQLDFGRVPLGVGRLVRFTVENNGTGSVSIDGWRAESEGRARIEVEPTQFLLVAQSEQEVTVRFTPLGLSDEPLEFPLLMQTSLRGDDAERRIQLRGQAVRTGVDVSADPLRFGSVIRGRTSTRTLTLSSRLPEAADLSVRIEARSGSGEFRVLAPRLEVRQVPGGLVPGGEVELLLEYRPAQRGLPGTDRAQAVFSYCPSPTCELQVGLEGEAITVPLVCAPDPVDFGAVRPERQRARFMACVNVSQRPVRVTSIEMTSDSDPVFSEAPIEPIVLAPGQRETFEVRLDVPAGSPSGSRLGTVSVETEDLDDLIEFPAIAVGTRVRVSAATLAVEPVAVDFGRVAVGLEGRAPLTLRNAGDGVLGIRGFTSTTPFSVDAPSVQLAEGESTTIDVVFRPESEGPQEGVLIIETDAPEMGMVEVPLGGFGVRLLPCTSTFEPAQLDFGAVAAFRTITRGVQVRNTGSNPCLIREGALAPGSQPPFTLVEGGGRDILLMPGEAWTFVIAFHPISPGTATGTLKLNVSDPVQPDREVPLRGSGRTLQLVLNPDEIDFGQVAPGCAGLQSVQVYNPTARTESISALRIVSDGQAAPPFTLENIPVGLQPGGLGLDLEPGASFSFSVRYVPTSTTGLSVARVQVETPSAIVPQAVALYGRSSLDPLVTERWRQAAYQAADILIVIDNSSSMQLEQEALRRSFPRFIEFARSARVDYRIGVITTDTDVEGSCQPTGPVPLPSNPRGACGYLSEGSPLDQNPNWRLVDPREQPSPEVAFAAVADVGIAGSAAEAGLYAATLATEPTRLFGWNTGLLERGEAFLGVLFMSDEQDQSPGDPRLYEAMLAATKGARFRDRFAISGIVIDSDVCGAGNGTFSSRYLGAIARSGGTAGSICARNYDDVVDRIARAAVGLRERFLLTRPAFSPSVEVRVDRVPLPPISSGKRRWTFDREGNAVVFEPASVPRQGSDVEISYRQRCIPP